jgi:hypothetical protein
MKITNDCLVQDTLTVQINNECVEISSLQSGNSDEILSYLMMMNQQQQKLIKEILIQLQKCCYRPAPTPIKCCDSVYVGQIVKDFTIIDVTPKQKPIIFPPQQPQPVYVKPQPTLPENIYSTVTDKNAFSIMGTGGSWTIINGDIVSSGVSLRRKIPIKLGVKNGDRILECIIDYKIVMGGGLYPRPEPILVYQIINTRTGGRTTFEAGPNHFRSWFR